MSDVTRLLDAAASGDPRAAAELLPLDDDERRNLATASRESERSDHTLDAASQVQEALPAERMRKASVMESPSQPRPTQVSSGRDPRAKPDRPEGTRTHSA